MNLDSVRELKASVSEKIVTPLLQTAMEGRATSVVASAVRRTLKAANGVALGVGQGHKTEDYRLAVRIQDGMLQFNNKLLNDIDRQSRGEVDLTYVGAVYKRTPPTINGVFYQARHRPVFMGVSIAHHLVTAGTLGGFFKTLKESKTVILSNNHVLANEDKAKAGDAIWQPGAYDGGGRKDEIGKFLDAVSLKPSRNLVDAAICSINPDILYDQTQFPGAVLRGQRSTPVLPGDTVMKVGRTTGLTYGTVSAIEVDDLVVGFDRGDIAFDRQIEIRGEAGASFSQGGDSGSLILDRDGYACALLFAGSDGGGQGGVTYANDLERVMSALNLTLEPT